MLKKPRASFNKYADFMIRINCTSFKHSIALHSENKLSSMSLIQHLVLLEYGCTITNWRISRNRKCTSKWVFWYWRIISVSYFCRKVVEQSCSYSKREGKKRNISVYYRFQFKIMHFICSYNYLSLFFYPNRTRAHISKQYHKNQNFRTDLIIRKTRKQLTTHSQFCIVNGQFHHAQSISLNVIWFCIFGVLYVSSLLAIIWCWTSRFV